MKFRDPRTVLKANGLWTKKQFGQNFLVDPNVVERIISVSGAVSEDIAYEIGAGCGTLTAFIAPRVSKLTSIEYDRDLMPVLQHELASHANVNLESRNVLDVEWHKESLKSGQPIMLFGNLPYHLSSEIILSLIETQGSWRRACFMVQKEFGERLAAKAGSRNSSSLSVQLESLAYTSVAFYVPPNAFVPAPKVDSCVIVIEPKPKPEIDPLHMQSFRQVVKALFGQRRKMARKALKCLGVDTDTLLKNAGLDGRRRGETFNLAELKALTTAFDALYKSST